MRDAARHIAPSRHALGRHKVRYIIKGNHIAFQTAIVRAARAMIVDPTLEFDALPDEEAVFRYHLHTMSTGDHIGTPLILAAWNAATYVAQIDGPRLDAAMASGKYVEATQRVLSKHERIWFNDEMYVVRRAIEEGASAGVSETG